MAAYIIAKYNVTNPEGFAAYGAAVRPTFAGHEVEFVAVDNASETLEGSPPRTTVVLKFPSKEAALGWYNSPEYQAIRHHRTDNSEGDMVLVEGFAPPA
ncbi:MAG TPA: DUF1330 domain-containing protein [Sphingomonadaceae bacterium]|nr:DUF1330 domain-containing protein [Sphingomonadaceae bacterium]